MCRDLILAGLLACVLLYLCIPLRQPQAPHNATYLVYATDGRNAGHHRERKGRSYFRPVYRRNLAGQYGCAILWP